MDGEVVVDELLNSLRYKSEGTDVDFKSTQYRFLGGDQDGKAEMLKDILAMANAWRDGPGYIVLGFKERRPHPAEVVGISECIDDAKIQQFVNGKTKSKLTFHYEEHLYEGRTIGVITIPKQKRPVFLSKAYGKLRSNVVYVRRGSSTDEADPDEIAAMARADEGHGSVRVDLSVLGPDNNDFPKTFSQRYLRYTERFPDYTSPRPSGGTLGLSGIWRENVEFWRELAEYVRVDEAIILMRFELLNRSKTQLSNAKLEVAAEALDGQGLEMLAGTDLPDEPQSRWAAYDVRFPRIATDRDHSFVVDDNGSAPICHIRFGSLLPGEKGRSSDKLGIIPLGPGKLRLYFRILASELPSPMESERLLESTGDIEQLDFERFKDFLRLRQQRRGTAS